MHRAGAPFASQRPQQAAVVTLLGARQRWPADGSSRARSAPLACATRRLACLQPTATSCHTPCTPSPHTQSLLGQVDLAFLAAYALGMFVAGHLGDRTDLRLFLSGGMVLSGIMTTLFGMVGGGCVPVWPWRGCRRRRHGAIRGLGLAAG